MGARYDRFADREAAGVALGEALRKRELRPPVVVLGLLRGGVPVAYQVALALRAPLDVMVVRKGGAPGQPDFAMRAIAWGGGSGLEPHTAAYLVGEHVAFEQLAQRERAE